MIEALVYVLVLAIIAGVVFYVIRMLPLPAPWGQIVQVLAALIFVLLLLGALFGGISVPMGLRR